MDTITYQDRIILASKVEAKPNELWITIGNALYRIPLVECSPSLARASETERCWIEVLPSGYGIHWPLIDEDLAVGPLVKGRVAVG